MYLGDPREQQIDLEKHTIWEEDNRVEKRYQWGAMVIDLCDLDPNEYAQTIFHTEAIPSHTTRNPMGVEINNSIYTIEYPYSTASQVVIVITDSDDQEMVITLPTGEISPVSGPLTGITASKVRNLFIGPSYEEAKTNMYSDGVYTYIVYKKSSGVDLVKYAYMKHTEVEQGLSEEALIHAGLSNASMNEKDAIFTYVIKPVIIPGFNTFNEQEFNRIMKEEQLDLLILSSTRAKNIYLNESEEQTNSWIKNYTTIKIDDDNYFVSRYVDPQLVNICDTNDETPTDILYNYKVTIQ